MFELESERRGRTIAGIDTVLSGCEFAVISLLYTSLYE